MHARSMQLLELAEKKWSEEGRSYADICKEIGMNRTALSVAKQRGTLAPVMAGRLAQLLGEDAIKWIAVAAIENAKNSKARTMLEKHLQAVAKG